MKTTPHLTFAIGLAAVAAMTVPVGVSRAAQPYAAWTKYRDITLNTTNANGGANVAGTQANFPLLVRLSSASDPAGANVLSEALADGADVRFSDSTGNVALAYEIESWNASAAAIWVKVPAVTGNANTKIRLYWNRPGATGASSGPDVFNAANGFVGVWHMGNPVGGNAQTGIRPNSLSPGTNDAVPANLLEDAAVRTGAIASADTLGGNGMGGTGAGGPGTGQHFNFGLLADNVFTAGGGAAISLWLKPRILTPANNYIQFMTIGNTQGGAGSGGAGANAMWIGKHANNATNGQSPYNVTGTNRLAGQNIAGTSNVTPVSSANNTLTLNAWQLITFSVNGTTHNLFLNGALVGTRTSAALDAVLREANYIGRSAWPDNTFDGVVDEARVSRVNRPADWNKLDYETQKAAVTAVTLGPAQTQSAPGLAYITKNATYALNQAIPTNTPVTSGAATDWSISPGLPLNLAFSTIDGAISGIPNEVSPPTQYVVSATVGGITVYDTLVLAVTAGTPPGAPTGVTAVSGNAEATVSWSAAPAGSSGITGYTARATQDTARTCEWTGGPLSCVVQGLANGTAYTFVVRATSAVGAGPFSSPSDPVVPATVPGAPTGVTAVQPGAAASVTVSWTAPENGGSPIFEYYVTGTPGGNCFSTAPTTTCTVSSGLAYNTQYTFTVYAVNTMGNGPLSAPSSPVTPTGISSGSLAARSGFLGARTFLLAPEAVSGTEAMTMSVVNVRGRVVWSRTVHPARDGIRELTWDARASDGPPVSAGVYVARVSVVRGGQVTGFVRSMAHVR